MRKEEKKWQERRTADLINDSLQEQFLFRDVPPQLGGSLGADGPWLACSLFPSPGYRVLGVKAQGQVLKNQHPRQPSSLWPGAGAKNKLGSIVDCFMVGGLGPCNQDLSSLYCRGQCHPQASCGQVLMGMKMQGKEASRG